MPIIKVDRGITKSQIKKIAVGTTVVAILMSMFIMRIKIEQGLADRLADSSVSPEVSKKLYTWAANSGSLYAQSQLGEFLRTQKMNKEDKISGESWLLIAAENGDLRSMYNIAYDTIIGGTYTSPINNIKALEYIKTSTNSGYIPDAGRSKTNYVIAYAYLNEFKKGEKDKQMMLGNAKEYAEKAHLNKETGASTILAEIYSFDFLPGWSDEQRLLKAIEYRKEMLKEGLHENGSIALLYYNLSKISPKQEYLIGVNVYAKKAIADPEDKNNKHFKPN